MSDEQKKQIATTSAVDGFDGYTDTVEGTEDDDRAASGGVIQGTLIKFANEATWETRDGDELSPELELIAVDILRVVQKWVDQRPVETRVLGPGEPVPDINALNDKCPRSEWGKDFKNNPRGPWQFQHITYLIDPATMDKYSWPVGTVGGAICTRETADKVRWMRKFRGQHVYPVVTLAEKFMNTKFGGRQRPHLVIKKWVQLGADQPQLAGPANEPAKAETSPSVKVVAEPTLSELMNDEVPFNDSPDPNVPKAASPPMPQRRPAAPSQKPHTTKRGVTKIAGRGR